MKISLKNFYSIDLKLNFKTKKIFHLQCCGKKEAERLRKNKHKIKNKKTCKTQNKKIEKWSWFESFKYFSSLTSTK